MPATKNAFLRYQVLDRALQKGGFPSTEKLQRLMLEKLDETVSSETIQKDIAFLKTKLQIAIRYSRSEGGYYYPETGTSLFKRTVSDADARDLEAAVAKLALFSTSPLLAPVQQTIERLFQYLELRVPLQNERMVLQPDDAPVASGTELISDMLHFIQRKEVVRFHYFSTTYRREMDLKVSPWLLKEHDGRWYLIGSEVGKTEPRLYGLDRITGKIVASYETWLAPPPDLAERFDHVVGVSEFYRLPETVDVFFKKPQDWYVRTKPIHRSQIVLNESNAGTTFRYSVVRNWEFEAEVRKQNGRMLTGKREPVEDGPQQIEL